MDDETAMRAALAQARRGLGHTSPNPAVGAVLVGGGRILARGYHRCAGEPHAEIEALKRCRKPAGATLYVTLEPCSTHGRTPPCTAAIIAANVRRVVVGATDPNPAHGGRAAGILEAAGIAVRTGVLEAECRALNPGFNKWIVTGMPHVIAKAALSLDGRIARPPAEDRWLSSPAARVHAHRLRARVDAILIGTGTLRADNPRLTVRGVGVRDGSRGRGTRQPWRVVVGRSGRDIPADARLFTDEYRDRTLLFIGQPLRAVLRALGRRGITSVLIEGGGRILGEAFDRRLVDAVCFYIAPLLVGGPVAGVEGRGAATSAAAPRILEPRYEQVGPDLILTGAVTYPEAR